jgi:hypothetical protein
MQTKECLQSFDRQNIMEIDAVEQDVLMGKKICVQIWRCVMIWSSSLWDRIAGWLVKNGDLIWSSDFYSNGDFETNMENKQFLFLLDLRFSQL